MITGENAADSFLSMAQVIFLRLSHVRIQREDRGSMLNSKDLSLIPYIPRPTLFQNLKVNTS